MNPEEQPHARQLAMHLSPRCGARTRSGGACRSAAMRNGRCRMHGGSGSGAPKGNKNAFRHGHYAGEELARRKDLAARLRDIRKLMEQVR